MSYVTQPKKGNELNRIYEEDLPVHEWYRFILSFPPHLVRDYLKKFNVKETDWVLDPFCGTGTTLIECKKNGIPSKGFESNPVVQYISNSKLKWNVNPNELVSHAEKIANETIQALASDGIQDKPDTDFNSNIISSNNLISLDDDSQDILIKNSISKLPLHKLLTLINSIENNNKTDIYDLERTALAKQAVYSISNLKFGPEVGVGKIKNDCFVVKPWLESIKSMAEDLQCNSITSNISTPGSTLLYDSRNNNLLSTDIKFSAIITSPPYPNEKDYSRTTRLESVLLGFIKNREDLRSQKQTFIRSNTRGIYKSDDDSNWIQNNERVMELAEKIERKRISLGKDSGFEKRYHLVVLNYFGGMAKHLDAMKKYLIPGAKLAYVVGDQASYLRVLIRTGEILGAIGTNLGYTLEGRDLFRTRFSTVTKENLNEEVVLFRWEG